MRITCPNCDAQYEVPDEVVPTEGRDVQCSNCGITWFQDHPNAAPAADSALTPVEEPSAPEQRQRRTMDPEVEDILREEAQRETAAREAETLETQPELGLAESAEENTRRAKEAQVRMAQMRAQEVEVAESAADTVMAATTATVATTSRRELLPDIEEINSTLRSTSDRTTNETSEQTVPVKRRKPGFRRGFSFALLLFSICVLLYVFAPQIAESIPQSDPWISAYVTWVDGIRVWLDGRLQSVLEWLDATAAASRK